MDSNNKETIYPPCLSLRIHSSVLLPTEDARSSDNDENEIFLPNDIVLRSTEHHECADKNLEGNISKRSSNSACGNQVCTSEEVGETGHLFVMTQKQNQQKQQQQDRGESHTTTTRQFDFLASSTTRQTIVVQPAGDQLKDYGRRARARSQQQRDNRKEIKLIDSSCLLVDQIEKQRGSKKGKPSKTIATSSSNTNVNSIGTKKRPRQSHHFHQTQLNTTKVARNNNKTGKLWIPDTSQIPIPSKDNQSKYVQLHFLPVGTTYEIIRKFFTGLIPQRIMILLSNRIDISVLDTSSYYDDVPYNLQELVYTNKDLRVIVKFDSISEAGLAVDRSGETIFSKQLEMRDNRKTQNRVDDRPDAFSIGVTKISKDLASSLSKLSIDAIPGIPLHYCLLKVESKLKPLIREILWTNTQQECIVVVDKKIKSAKLHLPLTQVGCEEGDDDDDDDELLTLSGYQKYANHYNRLLTIHNDLLMTVPPNKYDEAMISIDPIVRLTAHACGVLDNEMERIDNFLYQVRTIRKMVPEKRNLAE